VKYFLIIRHGEKEQSNESNYAVRKTLKLTEHGELEAFATGQYLKTHYPNASSIYSSDFPRCVETAKIITSQFEIQQLRKIEPLLNEHAFTYEAVDSTQKKLIISESIRDVNYKTSGGESVLESAERFHEAFLSISDTTPENEVTLIVTHARIFQNYLGIFLGVENMLCNELSIKSCSVSLLTKEDNQIALEMLNNYSHIPTKRYMSKA
jgi:broad specificity phosphatase PhoE